MHRQGGRAFGGHRIEHAGVSPRDCDPDPVSRRGHEGGSREDTRKRRPGSVQEAHRGYDAVGTFIALMIGATGSESRSTTLPSLITMWIDR